MRNSLDYSIRALAIASGQVHFKFNIAFVQIQIAQLMHSLPESQRTLAEVQAASEGLDAAIESFTQIAQSKNPPYPKHDIEQRANMGRNTMRHQLERAVQSQRKYEEKNAAKLQEARDARESELRKRQEGRRIAAEAAEEEKRKIAEERHKMLQISRELAEQRAEAERRKEEAEYTEDEETGERVKRKKIKKGGKRKKKGDDSGTDGEGDTGRRGKSTADEDDSGLISGEDTARPLKRRRKLAKRGGGRSDNYKSSEIIVDSDSEEDDVARALEMNGGDTTLEARGEADEDGDAKMDEPPIAGDDDDDEEEDEPVAQPRKPASRRIDDDDEDEDEDEVQGEIEMQPIEPKPPGKSPAADADNAISAPLSEDDDSDEDDKPSSRSAPHHHNIFADPEDLQMADANVTAAGDGDAAEY